MSNERRPVDRCEKCGRFVGFYPVNFYDDRYCRKCFDGLTTWGIFYKPGASRV